MLSVYINFLVRSVKNLADFLPMLEWIRFLRFVLYQSPNRGISYFRQAFFPKNLSRIFLSICQRKYPAIGLQNYQITSKVSQSSFIRHHFRARFCQPYITKLIYKAPNETTSIAHVIELRNFYPKHAPSSSTLRFLL